MARPTDEFAVAWRSLEGLEANNGWRSIPVQPVGSVLLRAGRRFPGNEEALLVGFPSGKFPVCEVLPEGKGFSVERIQVPGDDGTWLALTRRQSGSAELFAAMVADIAGLLDRQTDSDESKAYRLFLLRVRSWQDFMRKGAGALGPEREVGLIGELLVLRAIIAHGVAPTVAVEMWVGPFDSAQDFHLGMGGIEVKATLAAHGFPARIGSLEQLDDAQRQPLFVAGVRLARSDSGETLPDIVDGLMGRAEDSDGMQQLLLDRLIAGGYHETHRSIYSRRFAMAELRILEVGDLFPRLTVGIVPSGILHATYDIDLDKVPGRHLRVEEAIKTLGVL